MPQPVVLNSVCAAPCEGGWYRCQIVSYDEETNSCDVKYLDYGGYASLSVDSLKQIRTDFLSLPFQAIEVTQRFSTLHHFNMDVNIFLCSATWPISSQKMKRTYRPSCWRSSCLDR